MYNTNGRGGDVEFAKAVYSFLVRGEHINTRKLRELVKRKLQRDVPTQKIAQFVYNKKASGILALDEEKNNYLTEQGVEEAKRVLEDEYDLIISGQLDNDNVDNNADDEYDERDFGVNVLDFEQQYNAKPSFTNALNSDLDSIYDRLESIRDEIAKMSVSDLTIGSINEMMNLYTTLNIVLKTRTK